VNWLNGLHRPVVCSLAGQPQQVGPPQSISVVLMGSVNYIVLHNNIRMSHSIFLLFKKIDDVKLYTNPALFVSDLQDAKKNSSFFSITF
jgi:hypothetical protein